MPVEVNCNACSYTFCVPDRQAGKYGKCPNCQATIRAPGLGRESTGSLPAIAPGVRRSPSSQPQPLVMAAAGGGAVLVIVLIAFAAFKMGRSGSGPIAVTVPMHSALPSVAPVAAAPPPIVAQPIPSTSTSTTPVAAPESVATNATSVAATTAPSSAAPASTQPAVVPSAPPPKMELADLIEQCEKSVVRIEVVLKNGGSMGSGFVVDRDGTVVTNYHVIEGATKASVVFADKSTANVVGFLKLVPEKDIALLKIDTPSEKLHPIPLAEQTPRKGETVVAFGAPEGLSFSATEGIISGIRSDKELLQFGSTVKGTWLQTSAPISSGNSGGPLVNQRGEVVGANTFVLAFGQNLNFAISSLDIREAVATRGNQLIAIAPENVPEFDRNTPPLVDLSKTERGRKLLSELQKVHLLRARFTVDPTGRAYKLVTTELFQTLKRMNVDLTSEPGPNTGLLVLAMAFTDTGEGTVGTHSLMLYAFLMVEVKDDETGQPQLVTVWKQDQEVGKFSLQSIARGTIPRSAQTKISQFFNAFRIAYNRAKAELNEKTPATTTTEKSES